MRRKSLLAFPQQHLVVCHIFAYANPESHCEPVSLSLSPRGARCSRAALGAPVLVIAQSFRKFNLFRCLSEAL